MHNEIYEFVRDNGHKHLCDVRTLKENTLVLAKCPFEENAWYRGKVREVTSAEDGSGDADVAVDIFFVDTGESEVLPLCDLRSISARFLNNERPFAAIECVLSHVLPVGEGQ